MSQKKGNLRISLQCKKYTDFLSIEQEKDMEKMDSINRFRFRCKKNHDEEKNTF